MKTEIVVAIIAASASIFGAAVTFYLTKQKDREAEWRKQKLEHYKELLLAMSGIVGTDATPEGQLRFAKACNTVVLVASQQVVQSLLNYQDEISVSNAHKSLERERQFLNKLLLEVRKDIGISPADDPSTFSFALWCSGANESRNNQLPSSNSSFTSLPNSIKAKTEKGLY